MGKKNKIKDIVISNEELQPTTLGYLDESKKGNGLLIAFFAIFILVAIFLPNITGLVNKFMGKDNGQVVVPNNEKKPSENPEAVEIAMYNLTEDLVVKYNDLEFSKFTKSPGYLISFTITNNTTKSVNFKNIRYYIELYSDDKTMLGRHIFDDYVLNPNTTYEEKLEITENEYNNVSQIAIVQKDEKDYPDAGLKIKEDKTSELTCTKGGNTIVYGFDADQKITSIKDEFTMENDGSSTYKSQLAYYQARATSYNNKAGVSSNIVETLSGFTIMTEIDIVKADVKTLNVDKYYAEKGANVINFEMEARGYNCN